MVHYSPMLGVLEIICGPMFSGKSEELIRRLRRAQIARQRVQVFKAHLDVRYSPCHIVSHSDQSLNAITVTSSEDLRNLLDDRVEVIGIDEVQFFDEGIVEECERLANMGKRVIVAGLDLDYQGKPFDPVPALMAVADHVTKTSAICMRCGAPASRSQRLVPAGERVVIGACEAYEARCRRCFEPEIGLQLHMELDTVSKGEDLGS